MLIISLIFGSFFGEISLNRGLVQAIGMEPIWAVATGGVSCD